MSNLTIRFADEQDVKIVYTFIKGLAAHVRSLEHFTATEADLKQSLFEQKCAEVILCFDGDTPAGMALFFHNYSSFAGKRCLFLEDLYVADEMRGKGCGKALLFELAKIADERGCHRIDWNCLDWNKGSRKFYESLGAQTVEGLLTYQLETAKLLQIANNP